MKTKQIYSIMAVLTAIVLICSGCSRKDDSNNNSSDISNTSSELLESSKPEETSSKEDIPSSRNESSSSSTTSTKPPASSSNAGSSSSNSKVEVSVTIPEGSSFMQIANLLEQKGVCTKKEFYDISQTYSPKSFTIPISDDRCFRMEGYLFPDTYKFYKNDDPKSVLIKMLNNYNAKVGNLSDNELILASIIEKETRSTEHMKLVSSVFNNRLRVGGNYKFLDADPTREYVNNFITGNSLVSNQSKYAPLYNTCGKRVGLPAGPICSPGLRAINAAKNPQQTDYFFFFFGKDGTNHYSETIEVHNAKIQEIGVG